MRRHHILHSIFLILCVTLIPSCVNMQEDIQLNLFKQVTGVSLNSSSFTLTLGSSQTLIATVTPAYATNPAITWKSSDGSVASVDSNGRVTANKTGSAIITVTTEDGGKTATCSVTVIPPSSNTPEAVDLDLSVKWATFNVGANHPEEYGDYYAWGETKRKSDYSWSTYKWCNGSLDSMTKYCTQTNYGTVDNRTALEPEDDVAHVKWGGSWRMPTDAEFTELRNKCTWTWITLNGAKGYKVSSKTNGNSIFLPAAGYRSNMRLYDVGAVGSYWSSSLYTDSSGYAYYVYFNSSSVYRDGHYRYSGLSVRPVYGEIVNVSGVSLNKSSMILTEGDIETLIATISPSNATNKNISWESSDASVATVDASGKVTAVKVGTTTITVTTEDGGITATCSVTVKIKEVNATDLSASGTANCYIVSSAGDYKFKTFQGNTSTSVGSVSSAEVLWETFGTSTAPKVGDLVNTVSYSNGYITFKATGKEGNALIAAKDASGNILWSWHIWCTDKPEDQVYKNNAGTMMDRNLGATSATPGDVGALGLLYQWGRKDPFLGSSSISDASEAASTITWPSVVESTFSTGTIAYATSHPTTFITENAINYDWYYSASGNTDNTRWNSNKGIYDPCPPGYRVPDGGESGVWFKALGSSYNYENGPWDSTNKGINFKTYFTSSTQCWYPSGGWRDFQGFFVGMYGLAGYYWSCTTYDHSGILFNFLLGSISMPTFGFDRANALSVRCIRE